MYIQQNRHKPLTQGAYGMWAKAGNMLDKEIHDMLSALGKQ